MINEFNDYCLVNYEILKFEIDQINLIVIYYCSSTISMKLNVLYFRDYAGSGSRYVTPDSGGECGVPYETYFPMPTAAKDKPWFAIEQGSVHFTVISTEHDWTQNSEQVGNDIAIIYIYIYM